MKPSIAAVFGLVSSFVVGCGGNAPPPAAAPTTVTGAITGDDTPAGHKAIIDALTKAGHDCTDGGKAIACDAKKERAFTFAVVVAKAPTRLVLVVPSQMKVPCAQAAPRLNDLNHDFDTITLSCEDDEFTAAGVFVLPAAGIATSDLTSWVDGWLLALANEINANHLTEIVK